MSGTGNTSSSVWKNMLTLRGVAIIFVVLNHSMKGLEQLQPKGWDDTPTLAVRLEQAMIALIKDITPICIPVFFLVSGFILFRFARTWRAAFRSSRLLAWRYLGWSCLFYHLLLLKGKEDFSWNVLGLKLVTGGVSPGYWFFVVIIAFYLLAPALARLVAQQVRPVLALAAVVLLLSCAAEFLPRDQHPVIRWIHGPPYRVDYCLPFFILGMIFSKYVNRISPVLSRLRARLGKPFLLLVVLLPLTCTLLELLVDKDHRELVRSGHRICLVVSALLFVAYIAVVNPKGTPFRRWLDYVGNSSFGILLLADMLSYQVVLSALRNGAQYFTSAPWAVLPADGGPPAWIASWRLLGFLTMVVVGIWGPLLAMRFTERVLGRRLKNFLFG